MARSTSLAAATGAVVVVLAAWAATSTGTATAASTSPVVVTNGPSNPVPVTGGVTVSNFPAMQAVQGTVQVGNLPAEQRVSGTVEIGNLPAEQRVSGTVEIGNLPAEQRVSGEVTVAPRRAFSANVGAVWQPGRDAVRPTIALAQDVAIDTVAVEVSVPRGSRPQFSIGCNSTDFGVNAVFVPLEHQYTSDFDGRDWWLGTLSGTAMTCRGGSEVSLYARAHPAGTAGGERLQVHLMGSRLS